MIQKRWEIILNIKAPRSINSSTVYLPYKVYTNYVFPEIIRTPLAECATCFSSIYGSIFYWSAVALIEQKLFNWSNIPWLAAIFFWGVFCFSLSVLNTALAKRFN